MDVKRSPSTESETKTATKRQLSTPGSTVNGWHPVNKSRKLLAVAKVPAATNNGRISPEDLFKMNGIDCEDTSSDEEDSFTASGSRHLGRQAETKVAGYQYVQE